MAFGGEVHDLVGANFVKKPFQQLSVADITPDEAKMLIFLRRSEVIHTSCISKLIKADNAVLGVTFKVHIDEMRADEACTARYEDGHFCALRFFLLRRRFTLTCFAFGAAGFAFFAAICCEC